MKHLKISLLTVVSLLLSTPLALALPSQFAAKSALTGEKVQVGQSGKKGVVVVFLSAHCPCSNSHIVEIRDLSREYPDFEFVGVHSNTDEGQDVTVEYFERVALPFPVLQDTGAKIADEFKALKTPHAFVVLSDGTTAYEGGLSSSMHFDENTDRKFLREALSDLAQGQKVKTPVGRTLGCVIARGGKNVW